MKWVYSFFIVITFSCFQCNGPTSIIDGGCGGPDCVVATVKALNIDGCKYALVLQDSTQLIPELRVYIQAPKPSEDPAYYFTFVDGEKVCIQYNETNNPNICMAGKSVFLTYIVKVGSSLVN